MVPTPYILTQEGRITGDDYVISHKDDHESYISGFWKGGEAKEWKGKKEITGQLFIVHVSKEKRGKGEGKRLMEAGIDYMQKKGAEYFVTRPNEASKKILAKLVEEGTIAPEIESSPRSLHVYQIPKSAKPKPTSKLIKGREITLSLANGEQRRGQFAVVELEDVLASHNELSFSSSEGYPLNSKGQNINDRNYSDDKLAQERVRENARNLDPYRMITTSRTPSGSPIVAGEKINGKWIVVSGNNRTMSSKLAAQRFPEKHLRYNKALREEIASFGIDEVALDGFKSPFLVRIDYGFPAFQTQELAKYNQSTMKGKRGIDKTIERSNSLRENPLCATRIPQMIDEYERMSDFYADPRAQKNMLDALLQCHLITEQSIPEYFDSGYFTSAGKDLVESVLAGVILEKQALKASEIDGVKQARQVVVYAIPALIVNSTLSGDANLIKHVNEAILYINEVRSSKLPFDQFINQGALFSETVYHPWSIYLSRLMAQGQRKFKQAIASFNESMKRSSGAALFADQVVTADEAFEAYVIDVIPIKEVQLIRDNEDWLFIGDFGASIVYADRRSKKMNDFIQILHYNKSTGEINELIKEGDKGYKAEYGIALRKAKHRQSQHKKTLGANSKIMLAKAKKRKKLKLLQLT
jgi:GNAT superfamily N-acetyltransferase